MDDGGGQWVCQMKLYSGWGQSLHPCTSTIPAGLRREQIAGSFTKIWPNYWPTKKMWMVFSHLTGFAAPPQPVLPNVQAAPLETRAERVPLGPSPVQQQDQLHVKQWKSLSNMFLNTSSEWDPTTFPGTHHCFRNFAKDQGRGIDVLGRAWSREFI